MGDADAQRGQTRRVERQSLAPRVKKPRLTDPRLIFGTALVVGSVALGGWAMTEARANQPVYVASVPLVPGTVLDSSNLEVVQVRLLGHAGLYLIPQVNLGADQDPNAAGTSIVNLGYVVTQTVGKGEFIALSALAASDTLDHRIIAIPIAISPPEEVKVGAQVDLWHTDTKEDQQPPTLVAQGLTVSGVPNRDAVFTVSAAGQVHVVVPQQDVSAVLAAVQSPGSLALLPSPGGAR